MAVEDDDVVDFVVEELLEEVSEISVVVKASDAFGVATAKDSLAACVDMRSRLEVQACVAHHDAEVVAMQLAAGLPTVDPGNPTAEPTGGTDGLDAEGRTPAVDERDAHEAVAASAVASAEDADTYASRADASHQEAVARAGDAAEEAAALAAALKVVQAEKRALKAAAQRVPADARAAEADSIAQSFEDAVKAAAKSKVAAKGKGQGR